MNSNYAKVWVPVFLFILSLGIIVQCRDFYVGMFKNQDFLVAQDRIFKERRPYHVVVSKYGRVFNCSITYFRVVDRLGVGRGPRVEIIRGGLQKKHVVLRITSAYNQPISVNVYVGCENRRTTRLMYTKAPGSSNNDSNNTDLNATGAGDNSSATRADTGGPAGVTTAPA